MKKFLKYFFLLILIAFLFIFFNKIINIYDNNDCSNFIVEYKPDVVDKFITEDEIKKNIYFQYKTVEGSKIKNIEVEKIKNTIISNPFIKDAKVYKCLNNTIKAEIEQREVLVRVFTKSGKSFIIDKMGDIMPIPHETPLPIICATINNEINIDNIIGKNIFEEKNAMLFKNASQFISIYNIAKALDNNKNINNLISQIYINNDNKIELIPTIGTLILYFGDADDIEEKIQKISTFYSNVMPYYDIKKYSRLDLTIKNQLVFKKHKI